MSMFKTNPKKSKVNLKYVHNMRVIANPEKGGPVSKKNMHSENYFMEEKKSKLKLLWRPVLFS